MVFKHVYMGKTEGGVDEYCCTIINNRNDVVGNCKYYKLSEETEEVIIEFINITYEHRR